MTMQSTSMQIIEARADVRNIATYSPDALGEYWLDFFDPAAALSEVVDHVNSLAGQRPGRESHTERAYRDGLAYVITWLGCPVGRDLILPVGAWFAMPSRAKVRGLIAHLYADRNLSASTVNSKYLAPLRHFLKALAGQTPMPQGANEYMLIGMVRDELRAAADVKGPNKETTSNVSAAWSVGTRLNQKQVNAVLRSLNRVRLDELRDYALLLTAFYTGLRRAELAQITLNSMRLEGDVWLLYTIGKRSNIDPVTIPHAARQAILDWVEAYNDGMDKADPRRIAGDVPVWQALRRGGNKHDSGDRGFEPARGMTSGSIGDVIKRRVESVVAVDFAAHDTRRTFATMLWDEGVPVTKIQEMLRHADSAVTFNYLKNKPEYAQNDASVFLKLG